MTKKQGYPVRIWKEPTEKQIKELKEAVISAEGKNVSYPELMKRTFNIPNLKETLVNDAKAKKLKRQHE